MRLILLLLLAVVTLKSYSATKVSCKDQNGNDVDWWHMYLMTGITQDGKHRRYFYVTSEDYDAWKIADHFLENDTALPTQTLDPLYKDDKILLAAYNDVFPNGTAFDVDGAAKGVIATDGKTGMWLVHSVPGYPTLSGNSHVLPNGIESQSLFCLTLDAEGVEKVAEMLHLYQPHFYFIRNPLGVDLFPNLRSTLDGTVLRDGLNDKDVKLTTMDGKKMWIFGRNSDSPKELYAEIIAPALKENLFVRTYRLYDPKDYLLNVCNGTQKIYNMGDLRCPDMERFIHSWNDQSKWAVTEETGFKLFGWRVIGSDWICIGDLNRWAKHKTRGGGAVCHKSSTVSQLYRKLMIYYDKCE